MEMVQTEEQASGEVVSDRLKGQKNVPARRWAATGRRGRRTGQWRGRCHQAETQKRKDLRVQTAFPQKRRPEKQRLPPHIKGRA